MHSYFDTAQTGQGMADIVLLLLSTRCLLFIAYMCVYGKMRKGSRVKDETGMGLSTSGSSSIVACLFTTLQLSQPGPILAVCSAQVSNRPDLIQSNLLTPSNKRATAPQLETPRSNIPSTRSSINKRRKTLLHRGLTK